MELQKTIDIVLHNRKPIAAVFLIAGTALVITVPSSTAGMIFVLIGLVGLFWDNISAGMKK